jgi:hypothetical protein
MDTQLFLLLVGKHVQIDIYAIDGDVLQETTVGTVESVLFDGAPASEGQVTLTLNTGSVTITPTYDYTRVRVFA